MLELRARYALLLLKLLLMFNNSFWKGVTGIMKNLILILGALFWLSACGGSKEEALGSAFFCSSYDTEPTCIQDNCVWDPTNKCLSTSYSLCSWSTEATSCAALECMWDPAHASCRSAVYTNCASIKNSDNCNSNGCVWDESKVECASLYTIQCIEVTKAADCKRIGCVWDRKSKCLSKTLSSCSSATEQASCLDINQCGWYQTNTPQCLKSCSAYNAAYCPSNEYCDIGWSDSEESNVCTDKK